MLVERYFRTIHESELFSFHVARVQKWIHIIANRLHLYYKLTTNEEETEEFELLHDGGCDLPFDVPGFEAGKFDFYQNVIKDKLRIRKPREHKQSGRHSQSPENTKKMPLNSKSNSSQSISMLLHYQVYILVKQSKKIW